MLKAKLITKTKRVNPKESEALGFLPVVSFLAMLALAYILASSSAALGREDGPQFKTQINLGGPAQVAEDQENGIGENDEDKNDSKDGLDSRFRLDGEITALAESSFKVGGEEVFVNPGAVADFKQKGILKLGKRVKVEGVIIDGLKYAREIMLVGEGQGRFQIQFESNQGVGLSFPAEVKLKAVGSLESVKTFLKQILEYFDGLISNLF